MSKMTYALAALVAAAGCSSVQVRSTPAPTANLTALRTFAFMSPVDPNSRAAALDRSPAGQQIRMEIARDLIDKGYTPAPPGAQPDFLIAYRADLRQKLDVQSWGYPGPYGWGWGWGWGGWAWGWGWPAYVPMTGPYYTEGFFGPPPLVYEQALTIYDWDWKRGPIHLRLTYERGKDTFEHQFEFDREPDK